MSDKTTKATTARETDVPAKPIGVQSWGQPLPNFPKLTHELCLNIIEDAERGLTRQEILARSRLTLEMLNPEELEFFEDQYCEGEYRGKRRIAEHLMIHSKKDLQATMAYLQRFAANYEKGESNSLETFGFVFNNKPK